VAQAGSVPGGRHKHTAHPEARGGELTPSFHGDNGNARKDQGRADLKAMMLRSLQPAGDGLG